ncbi:MAG: hypothetical protein CSB06_00250 [Bacteroidia bacterium]|nr:MAG: hypothetical protein CSB06_00250 [Bacteroidia bacterium]
MLPQKRAISIYIVIAAALMVGLLHFFLHKHRIEKSQELQYKIQALETVLYSADILQLRTISKEQGEEASAKIHKRISTLIVGGNLWNYTLPPAEKRNEKKLEELLLIADHIRADVEKGAVGEKSRNASIEKILQLQKKSSILQNDFRNRQNKLARSLVFLNFLMIAVYLSLLFLLLNLSYKGIKKTADRLANALQNIISGKKVALPDRPNDNFSGVYNKVSLIENKLENISLFVNKLLSDDYEFNFEKEKSQENPERHLIKLRKRLKDNIELNKKRQEEEQLRQWVADGRSRFNNILREHSSDTQSLADEIIKNLCKFLGAEQGGFFVLRNADTPEASLELISAFAYDRIKSLKKTIKPGEELPGMCLIEQNTLWITKVPEGYMSIESGLGQTSPANILLIPLKSEEKIQGVIELAGGNLFTKNQIKFVEEIGENIAAVLETSYIGQMTQRLLEESRKKSEELASKDSEMSEKIAELHKIQKETKISEAETGGLIAAMDKLLIKVEISPLGKIMNINELYVKKTGFGHREVLEKDIRSYITPELANFDDILQKMNQAQVCTERIRIHTKSGDKIAVDALFSPLQDAEKKVYKILLMTKAEESADAQIVSEYKLVQEDLLRKNQDLKEENRRTSEQIQKLKKENEQKAAKLKTLRLKTQKKQTGTPPRFSGETEKKYALWLDQLKNTLP